MQYFQLRVFSSCSHHTSESHGLKVLTSSHYDLGVRCDYSAHNCTTQQTCFPELELTKTQKGNLRSRRGHAQEWIALPWPHCAWVVWNVVSNQVIALLQLCDKLTRGGQDFKQFWCSCHCTIADVRLVVRWNCLSLSYEHYTRGSQTLPWRGPPYTGRFQPRTPLYEPCHTIFLCTRFHNSMNLVHS